MKIIKLEFIDGYENKIYNVGTKLLAPVTISIKKYWFSKIKKIDAYPTTYGITYNNNSIIFYIYVDENGIEFSNEISKQINNWIRNQQILGLFPDN